MKEARYFCFHLGGRLFALPLGIVQEVIPRVITEVLPEQPAGVIGLINLHGRPLVLLDTGALLGIDRSQVDTGEAGGEHYIMVLETPQGLLGLFMDELEGIRALDEAAAHRPVAEVLPRDFPVQPRLVASVGYLEERPVFVLDPTRLFSPAQMRSLHAAWEMGLSPEDEKGTHPS